ncbi:MAG: urease accessory protein [Flammeovirgaceae bacterium]
MTSFLPILFAAVVGFGHAFEADHLVAVSNIVTKRTNLKLAMKDGIFWGLGHTSTILLVGIIIIIGKLMIHEIYFSYLEACVGLMLLLIGVYRLRSVIQNKNRVSHTHLTDDKSRHHIAYGIGAVHGLAGSGVMVLLVMTEVKETIPSLLYLLIFGLGSVAGMLVASGLFSLPFSKLYTQNRKVQLALIVISSALCIFLGGKIIHENIFG